LPHELRLDLTAEKREDYINLGGKLKDHVRQHYFPIKKD
jgi:hypothetical protein